MRLVLAALTPLFVRIAGDDEGYFCCDIEHPPFCMQVPDASPCPWSAASPFRDESVCEKACFGTFAATAVAEPRHFCFNSPMTPDDICVQECSNQTFVGPNGTRTGSCPRPYTHIRETFEYESCDDGVSKNQDCRAPAKLVNVTLTVLGTE